MVRVKICGITNRRDAMFCIDHGADALGFVFFKESPRYISPEKAQEIINTLPPFITNVGLFVNETVDNMKVICNSVKLDVLQFHGDEEPEYVNPFKKKLIKAFRIKENIDKINFSDYNVDAYLLDSYSKEVYGGSGTHFCWDVITGRKFDRPVILAGGLTPDNVVEAIQMVRPYAVDVSSGVEKSKGIKDFEKVKKFIIRAKHGRYEK